MNIYKTQDGGCLTLKVDGRLDTSTSPQLEAELKLDGVNEVVIDFGGLEYISSAGLRVLMMAHRSLMACGGKITIVNPNTIVKGVFDITGMSSVFNIVEG